MKKLTILFMMILLAGSGLAKVNLPSAEEFTLANGMTVQVIERHTLPLFSLQLSFRAGSIHDPTGQEGLASLTNEMFMRGTTSRTAKQIAEEVAFGGGELYNFCRRSAGGFRGEFLTEQAQSGFEILADLVLNSTISDEELTKTKARTVAGLKSRLENPRAVAGEKFNAAILGDSRYAHSPGGMVATVEALTRDDLVTFRTNHYTPDNCLLVISGDVDPATVKSWVENLFGDWQGKASIAQINESFAPITGKEVLLYDKKDASQTQIRLGATGISLSDPDYPALEAVRTVFGGSYMSRLNEEIRINRGLTYGASYVSQRYQPGGLIYASTFTKNESVGEVIDIILAETERVRTEPVPDSELDGSINYRRGLYPLGFETNDDMVGVFSNMWLNKLERSYYEDFQEKLQAVTPEQGLAVAQKHFALDNYRLVLVGKADEVAEQAAKYGTVTVIELDQEQ